MHDEPLGRKKSAEPLRALRVPDPVRSPRPGRAGRRHGHLVHTQAPAPEPRRRRRARSGSTSTAPTGPPAAATPRTKLTPRMTRSTRPPGSTPAIRTRPTLYNTEVTDDRNYSPRRESMWRSTRRLRAAMSTPTRAGTTPLERPRAVRQAHAADAFSPRDAHYVDVGVRERDQRTFMGMFGAQPLPQRSTRPRRAEDRGRRQGIPSHRDPRPGHRRRQRSATTAIAIGATRLHRRPSRSSPLSPDVPDGVRTRRSGARPSATQRTATRPASRSHARRRRRGGGDYIPISTEVRVAGVDQSVIDIDDRDVCATS